MSPAADGIAQQRRLCVEVRAQMAELCEIQRQVNSLRQLEVGRQKTRHAAPATCDTHAHAEGLRARGPRAVTTAAANRLAELEPLFLAADVGPEHRENIYDIFTMAAGEGEALDLDAFTEVMAWLQVPREHCRQYFKAFDLDARGTVDFRKFLLGVTAMDNATWHGVSCRLFVEHASMGYEGTREGGG
eukprot:COSAG01_NODE_4386_length_5078_cov_16.813818_2_plen_188_part_00